MEPKNPILMLVNYLRQYGNCKIFLRDVASPNVNHVIDISIGKDGKINISERLQLFDKTILYGENINKSAKLVEEIYGGELPEEELKHIIAILMYATVQHTNIIMTAIQMPIVINADLAIQKIYQISYLMCQLQTSDLKFWYNSTESAIIHRLETSVLTNAIISQRSSDVSNVTNDEELQRALDYAANFIRTYRVNTETFQSFGDKMPGLSEDGPSRK